MNKPGIFICLVLNFFCSLIIFSCSKKEKVFDEVPRDSFTATLTFIPETGGYATNQNESTISNVSLTAITSPNYGIDSLRIFGVSFNGKYTVGTTTLTPDYVLQVYFKAPKVNENIPTGVYLTSISSSNRDATAGELYVRNTPGPITWFGSYPMLVFSKVPYAKVVITNSYSRNLEDGVHKYVDGTIDAYFVLSGVNSSSEVHVTGTFSGTGIR
jgi:hypothetical protein